MKNVIKIDAKNPHYFTLNCEDNGTNGIFIQFVNQPAGAVCEIYYGDQYYEQLEIPTDGLIEIPSIYYSDGSNMHFRYKSNDFFGSFFHIIGDGSRYADLVLNKLSITMLNMTGLEEIPVVNYLQLLASIISDMTKATDESCYKDLNRLRKSIIKSLLNFGVEIEDSATIETIYQKISSIEIKENTNAGILKLIPMKYACGISNIAGAYKEVEV